MWRQQPEKSQQIYNQCTKVRAWEQLSGKNNLLCFGAELGLVWQMCSAKARKESWTLSCANLMTVNNRLVTEGRSATKAIYVQWTSLHVQHIQKGAISKNNILILKLLSHGSLCSQQIRSLKPRTDASNNGVSDWDCDVPHSGDLSRASCISSSSSLAARRLFLRSIVS